MGNQMTCPSCHGARFTMESTTIDRKTGKRVSKSRSLFGGIAASAFGVVALLLGMWTIIDPVEGVQQSNSPLWIAFVGLVALVSGIGLVVGYVRADKVEESVYRCYDCNHQWHSWEGRDTDQRQVQAGEVQDNGHQQVHDWRMRALQGNDVKARLEAIQAFGVDRDTQAVQSLVQVLQTPGIMNAGNRKAAAEALGKIGDPAAVEPLVAAMDTRSDVLLAAAAAHALGEIGGPNAEDALIAAVDGPTVLIAAVDALGQTGGPKAGDGLNRALEHKNKRVRAAAAEALAAISEREAGQA